MKIKSLVQYFESIVGRSDFRRCDFPTFNYRKSDFRILFGHNKGDRNGRPYKINLKVRFKKWLEVRLPTIKTYFVAVYFLHAKIKSLNNG